MLRTSPSFASLASAGRLALAALTVASLSACASQVREGSEPWSPPAYWDDEHFVEIAGERICYLEAGPPADAPGVETLVFVHGWSGNLQNWWDQYEHFSLDHHVVVFDAPGHGKSERDPEVSYTPELYVEVLDGLFDALDIERATVIGNSAGGYIAAEFAIEHPEHVERLVLSDSTGTRHLGSVAPVLPFLNARWLQIANLTSGEHYPGQDPKSQARQTFVASFEGTVEEAPYLQVLADLLRPSYARIPKEALASIEAPTLVLWGDDDPIVPVKAMETFEDNIPTVTSYVIHLGGHTPMMTSPDEFNCALRTFLSQAPMDGCKEYALTVQRRRDRLAGKEWGPRYDSAALVDGAEPSTAAGQP